MALSPSSDPHTPGLAAPVCLWCNYSLEGLADSKQCPECGKKFGLADVTLRGPEYGKDAQEGPGIDWWAAILLLSVPLLVSLLSLRWLVTWSTARIERRLHLRTDGVGLRSTGRPVFYRWSPRDRIGVETGGTGEIRVHVEQLNGQIAGSTVHVPGSDEDARALHGLLEEMIARIPSNEPRPDLSFSHGATDSLSSS